MSSEGYLIKKTIQQFPIRHRPIYYEDYTDQNLLLFINKKLADVGCIELLNKFKVAATDSQLSE